MKIEKKTYLVVDSDDLDEAIVKEYKFERGKYGKGFESTAVEEWNNNSNYIINVDGENDDWDQAQIDKRKPSFGSVSAYLNDMAKRGVIARGEYLIKVSW